MSACARGATVVAAWVSVSSASAVVAQESVNLGSISRRVTDAQAAVVPGATATAHQVETDTTVGNGGDPSSPWATFNQVTPVRDPRAWPLAVRGRS
jgi:hypothetical protein